MDGRDQELDGFAIPPLEAEIRRLINLPRKRSELRVAQKSWDTVCSSLDIIEDIEVACGYFAKLTPPFEYGHSHLLIYGLLQALVVQQDAIRHLCRSLGVRYPEKNEALMAIRDLRNGTIGHPVCHESNKSDGETSNFISRPGIVDPRKFTHMKAFHGRRKTMLLPVDLIDTIAKQRTAIAPILSDVVKTLKEEEMEHRHRFKDKKLTSLFGSTLGYEISQFHEALYNRSLRPLAEQVAIGMLKITGGFRDGLCERGIEDTSEGTSNALEEIEYSLNELRSFFADGGSSHLNDRDAAVFAFFVKHKLDDLKNLANDIDREYETEA